MQLAAQAAAGDRKRRRQRKIRIRLLLGMAVMAEVIRAIQGEARTHRRAAQPVAHPVVQTGLVHQQAMRGVVHEDRQAELPAADQHHGQHEAQGVGPQRESGHGREDDAPGVHHQPDAAQAGALAQRLRLLCAQERRLWQGLRSVHQDMVARPASLPQAAGSVRCVSR